MAELAIAVNRKYRTKEGEDREEVTFIDCECWGPRAEVIAKYFSKGKPIFLEGRLKLDSMEYKDGQKRSKMRVVIEDFQFVESRSGGGGGGGGGGESSRGGGDEYSAPRGNRGGSSGQSSGQSGGGHAGIQEDDIPF